MLHFEKAALAALLGPFVDPKPLKVDDAKVNFDATL